MSAVRELKAVARERSGKGGARAERRQGRVPAVIYGGGADAVSIALDGNEMRQLIFAGHFLTTIFELDVGGNRTRVIPRDYQLDPVKDLPLHVDFMRLAEGQTITVEVPVHFVGQENCRGLKRGGTLNVVRHTVELIVPSDQIPDAIEASLEGLDINDSLHISAVTLPAGARPVIERDFTLATIAVPAGFKEEAPEATEAAPAAS
ncbi:50S ribosomal protein L25/general stress protein Ctc [Enterovirga aerilata]|uniref:Large ribosomal subunit protein bL25 n=1 Tax=Enterovirga aerilata TaxID=2730920 RepID=A0A849IES1_9HYPH|nr:50S ribosomal protein L25/general stress protein Ctc [Enterovirga sp. DB1703]NNM74467.1 50S ribosomal protein L25/general stress protein Ctc [Enterovirga sp. DB1703]